MTQHLAGADKEASKSKMNMLEAPNPDSLSCLICAKIFTNKKSLVRHTSYCRKSIGRERSRKRACQACTKAKARCDAALPHCSRCSARSLTCDYAPGSHTRHRLQSTKSQSGFLQSNDSNNQFTHSEIVKSHGRYEYPSYPVSLSKSFDSAIQDPGELTDVETSGSSDGSDFVTHDFLYSAAVFPKPLRLFVPEAVGSNNSPLMYRYLLCTLRSYPVMMLRGQNPPFIHPRYLFEDPRDFQSRQRIKAGPLAVCNELLQMFTMKNRDNVVQIWRAIRMEQERLLMEYRGFDYENTLGALQAVAIYFILRIFEKNEEATNFDVPLVQTMLELAVHLTRLENARPPLDVFDWHDWILMESKFRTSLFLCLMPFFFNIYPAIVLFHHCTGEALRSSRLPSGRSLWQAGSKLEWITEYELQFRRVMPPHGPNSKLTYANLLDYNRKNDGSLDFWLSEVDDFGNFVVAAASIQD